MVGVIQGSERYWCTSCKSFCVLPSGTCTKCHHTYDPLQMQKNAIIDGSAVQSLLQATDIIEEECASYIIGFFVGNSFKFISELCMLNGALVCTKSCFTAQNALQMTIEDAQGFAKEKIYIRDGQNLLEIQAPRVYALHKRLSLEEYDGGNHI